MMLNLSFLSNRVARVILPSDWANGPIESKTPQNQIRNDSCRSYGLAFLRFFRCGLVRVGVTVSLCWAPAMRAPRKAAATRRFVSSSPKNSSFGFFIIWRVLIQPETQKTLIVVQLSQSTGH